MAGAPNDSPLLWLNVDGIQQAPAGTMRNLTQATQQARGRRFVGTLAWSTYKLCPATVAQPQKLLYEHGVGVVGTLAWSTYKLCTATVAQPLNLTTCTGLAWSARWRGQRINGDLLRWHNPTVCQTSITRHGQLGRWVGSALKRDLRQPLQWC